MSFTDVLTASPHIRSGKLRVLGVTAIRRSRTLPGVPTLDEQGLKDFDATVFFGIVTPSGTPQDVVSKLNAAFMQVVQQPDMKERLSKQGLEAPVYYSPAQLAVYMRKEAAKWRDVIKIEPPQGDETRNWGPHFENGVASWYMGLNRNKRGMRMDLTQGGDREQLLTLLADADVLLENFKTGPPGEMGSGLRHPQGEIPPAGALYGGGLSGGSWKAASRSPPGCERHARDLP